MISQSDPKARQKFLFSIYIRLGIFSGVIGISFFIYYFFEVPYSIFPIIFSILGAILLTSGNLLLVRWIKLRLVVYLQALIDILLITLLVYLSGGIVSPFYFLYIIPIVVAGIFLSRRETLYIAAYSYIAFGALANLMYLDVIPFFGVTSQVAVSEGTFIYNLFMSFLAFSSIALIASYYFERLRKTGAELRNVQENLKDLALLNNTVMERMENGFITCDAKGILISFNETAKKMLNLLSHMNIFKLLFTDVETETSQKENQFYFEKMVNQYYLGISVSMIGHIYSFERIYVFILTNLTEKKNFEKKLKEKEHLAFIGEMAAGIAHEIRNPLASISGSIQFIKTALKTEDKDLNNLMDIIVNESNRLSNSIEGFLNFSRVTPMEITSFDLAGLLDNIVELMAVNKKDTEIVRNYAAGIRISADSKKISQMIWNLLSNAFKAVANTPGGRITIDISREDTRYFLSIRDNGIGLDSEELNHMFEPFFSKFTSGIGLGMAIVKRIVDEHRYDIQIISKKNQGTEVKICMR